MTNFEKYKNEIFSFINKPKSMCTEFIRPIVLKDLGRVCDNLGVESDVLCSDCYNLFAVWLMDEYKEPEVD